MHATRPDSPVPDLKHRSPWPRRMLILFFLILPFGLLLQFYIYFRMFGLGELREATAEADRLDPDWRLKDLLAKRKKIPDEENAALLVMRVTGVERPGTSLIPRGIPSSTLSELLEDARLPPPMLLNEEQANRLRDEMTKAEFPISLLQQVEKMPKGRYPLEIPDNIFEALLPHAQSNRTGVSLMRYYAYLLSHDNMPDEALAACRAAMCVSRVFRDEPMLISMLVRIAGRRIALEAIERVLAQGQASEEALAETQKLLEAEEKVPLLLYGMRGERAAIDHFFRAYEAGRIKMDDMFRLLPIDSKLTGVSWMDAVIARAKYYYEVGSIPKNRAAMLRMHNRVVEAARLPVEQHMARLGRIDDEIVTLPYLARMLLPGMSKVMEANLRQVAWMRCMIATLAAERFRLKNKRWPAKLDELVPEFLPAVPVDPYNKSPIILKRQPDGLLIYSVGRNGVDDGGSLYNRITKKFNASDLGYQLWDADQRRQPAKAVPLQDTDE